MPASRFSQEQARAPHIKLWHIYDGICFAPFELEPGASYTASVYLRASGPVNGAIGLKSSLKYFDLQELNQWKRVSATVEAKRKVDFFYITLSADGPRTLWLDCAQLEKGQPTDYPPGAGVDVGIFANHTGRIWRESEDVSLLWELRARSSGTKATVRFLIHDALGRILKKDGFTVSLEPGKTLRRVLFRGKHPTGAFRIAYTVESTDALPYSGQACYAVIPDARGKGEGPVGLYATHSEQCFSAMKNAGFHWTNTLSSAGHFAEWRLTGPEKGRVIFHDRDITLARKYGIKILANINTNRSSMPKWLLRPKPGEGEWIRHPLGYFKLSDWEEFVYALAQHYHNYVKHWLIIDEPDVGTNVYSPEDYAKMVRSAYHAIKKADEEAVLFAHTGTHTPWQKKLFSILKPGEFDGLYAYIGRFSRARGAEIIRLAEKFRCPVWTVDFAPVRALSTRYAEIDPEKVPPLDGSLLNTLRYDEWAVRSLSWGRAEKWFRYDARYPGPPPGTSYMSIWEHDGSLTPHGVSIAVMNALLSDALPEGEIEMSDGVEGHLFSSEDRKLLIAWTTDGSIRRFNREGIVAWNSYGTRLEEPLVTPLPGFFEFRGQVGGWETEVVEYIEAELLPPEKADEPYQAKLTAHLCEPSQGEWVVQGPYFLKRKIQRFPCLAEDGRAELIVPLNVWQNLPVRNREARVRLFLPGRMLEGKLPINTAK